jgi:hypothetical protein
MQACSTPEKSDFSHESDDKTSMSSSLYSPPLYTCGTYSIKYLPVVNQQPTAGIFTLHITMGCFGEVFEGNLDVFRRLGRKF